MKFLTLLLMLMIVISCSSEKRNISSKKGATPISVKKYDTPAGADPTISAELGGEGFDEIAESLGYVTNSDFLTYGDPKAVKGGSFKTYISFFPTTYRGSGKGSNEVSISTLNGHVYERLLGWDKDYNFTPVLASHWKIDDDNLTYYFRVDPEARFSDGKPVTTEDIYYTWKLLVDEGIIAPYTTELYQKYEMEIVSKYIIKVKSKVEGWKQFLNIGIWMDIYPAHHLKKVDGTTYLKKYHYKMLPGTGPYVLDSKRTIKGKKMVLRRRSDYWADKKWWNVGVNNFNELIYDVISDRNLAFEKFKKGELDYFSRSTSSMWINQLNYDNPGPGLDDIMSRGLIQKKKIYNFEPKSYNGFAFNMRKAPFDDIRVRKAFAMLYNRKQIIEKIELGEQKAVKSHWPWGSYENKNNRIVTFDPGTANRLLDEAGWDQRDGDGFRYHKDHGKLELTLNILNDREKYYTPYQEDLKAAGVKLNLKLCDFPTQLKLFNSRAFKFIHVNWFPAGAPNLTSKFHSRLADMNETNNMTGIKIDRLDEISELYKKEFDPKKRVRLVQETDSIAYNQYHYAMGFKPPWTGRLIYWNKFGMPKSVWGYRGSGTTSYWWYDKEKDQRLEKARDDKTITFPIEEHVVDYWGVNK